MSNPVKITKVTRYRARYKSTTPGVRTRVVERATLPALYSRVAWWMVVDRCCGVGYLPDVKKYKGIECDCRYDENGNGECPLHNRATGYFRLFQERVARWLEKGYIQTELPGDSNG